MNDLNPSNRAEPAQPAERKRIPYSQPSLKLAVQEIPGYYLYWFLDTGNEVQRAQAAGYEFVSTDEVNLTNRNVSGDVVQSGNADMGTRVSVFGSVGANGQPEMLYLMKQRQEWHEEDRALDRARNKRIEDAIRRRPPTVEGESLVDAAQRYVKIADLQTPSLSKRRS